jgi:hypothetical protein
MQLGAMTGAEKRKEMENMMVVMTMVLMILVAMVLQ